MGFEKYRNWLKEHDMIAYQEFDYLDTINLSTIICANSEKTCHEIMQIIEDEYEDDYLSNFPNDEMLFNSISENDFVEYIHWRYNIPVTEEITYRFFV